ncbi:MAG: hypothetical protein AAFW98_15730 [Pseudomonadota bacterium]
MADTAVQLGDLASVALSGDYSSLSNRPTVPQTLADLINRDAASLTGTLPAERLDAPAVRRRGGVSDGVEHANAPPHGRCV